MLNLKHSDFAARLFRYFARLHETHALPVYPIVIFSFQSPRRKQPCVYEVTFPDLQVHRFRYRVIQLNRLNWRVYARYRNPVASALMTRMNIEPRDRPRVKLESMLLLTTLKLDPARQRMITGFIDTYLNLTRKEMEEYNEALSKLDRPQKEALMEFTTNWTKEALEQGRQEGLQQGLVQGLEQGKKQGMAAVVEKQLVRRLGQLSPDLLEQVGSLDVRQLDCLSEALLEFNTVADLRQWLLSL